VSLAAAIDTIGTLFGLSRTMNRFEKSMRPMMGPITGVETSSTREETLAPFGTDDDISGETDPIVPKDEVADLLSTKPPLLFHRSAPPTSRRRTARDSQ
jgi:hypothetical protein